MYVWKKGADGKFTYVPEDVVPHRYRIETVPGALAPGIFVALQTGRRQPVFALQHFRR